jgi:hypothetical protein
LQAMFDIAEKTISTVKVPRVVALQQIVFGEFREAGQRLRILQERLSSGVQ